MILGAAIAVTLELVVFLPVSILAALAFAKWTPQSRDHRAGAITGAGLPFLYLAWVNREPGDSTPWPWLIIGVGLMATGLVAHRRQRASEPSDRAA
jgi:hypothetical protein